MDLQLPRPEGLASKPTRQECPIGRSWRLRSPKMIYGANYDIGIATRVPWCKNQLLSEADYDTEPGDHHRTGRTRL
jgi:hypothetical protein